MTIQTTKLIEVLDVQAGRTKTTEFHQDDETPKALFEDRAPYPRGAYNEMTLDPLKTNRSLTEAAIGELSVSNFPDLLRMGIQFDALTGFNEVPTVYERLTRLKPSRKQQEEYQDDQGIGLLPVVAEGQNFPEAAVSLGGGTTITNHKRGMIIPVTMEAQMFDELGKVRETAELLGRAARMTREHAVMNVLTTITNYKNKNNNKLGQDNQADLDPTPTNLNLAMAAMLTQQDGSSGQLLGVSPTILLIGPLLERWARMLIGSPDIMRAANTGGTAEVYGMGTNNPFFGMVQQVIVSPHFSASYDWALIDPSKAVYFQQVQGITVEVEGANMSSESWLTRQVIRYRVWDYFGVGMRDDRYAFLSNNTTAPAAS